MLEHEGLADHAAHLLSDAGAKTHAVLVQAYAVAAAEQRQRILTILVSSLGKASIPVFVQALLTPDLYEVAASLLIEAEEQFQEAALAKLLRETIGKHLDDPMPDACLTRILEVLAHVDRASSRATFLRFTAAKFTIPVRCAAYRALRGSKLPAAQVKAMIALLEDPAEKEVHGPVREVLAEVPEVPQGLLPVCKRLLSSRNPEQRLFALRMLRNAGGAEMAKATLKLLDHDDERFRLAAADALSNNKQAIEPLARLLQSTKDESMARVVHGILLRLGPVIPQKTLRTFAEKSVKLFGNNLLAGELLFDVVVRSGGAKVVPVLVEKAVRLRRARRFAEALHILAKLLASEHGTDEASYQLALTRLLVDMAHPDAESNRPGNATMGFFSTLVRAGFPVIERLRRESSVTPEAMLSIATHFAHAVGEERRFGTDLLKHLATRNKGRAGEEARYALRSAGVG
ncbi:MAG: HEAT repeat domain-containing protein [Planctomycetes bacterium]|nr:HEAT repeat domain-containing protein [Planctomycetota bacterium]